MSTGNTAMLPVQAMVYTTLAADAPLTALVTTAGIDGGKARIYDEVPPSLDLFPYIQVGEASEVIDNTFSTAGRAVEVTLHIYSQAQGWKEAQAILEELVRLLDDTLLPNPAGWVVYMNYYLLGQEIRDPDGTRHILARFTIKVERPRP